MYQVVITRKEIYVVPNAKTRAEALQEAMEGTRTAVHSEIMDFVVETAGNLAYVEKNEEGLATV